MLKYFGYSKKISWPTKPNQPNEIVLVMQALNFLNENKPKVVKRYSLKESKRFLPKNKYKYK